MGSFPLAALHVNPPVQQADPVEGYARLLQLKNMIQNAPIQRQEAQNQVQAGQLENQQRQQQLTDQQGLTAAMQGWDGKDYNDLLPLAVKHGVSAQTVMGLKSKIQEQQQSISTTLKNNAEGGKAQIEAVKARGDVLDGTLSALADPKQVSDEQLPQALVQAAQDLAQKGVLDPAHAQQAAQLAQSGNPAQIRQQLDLMRKTNMAQSQILDEAQKKAQTGEAIARTNEANVNANLAPQRLASEQANQAATRRQEQQRIGIEGARLGLERQKASIDQMQSGATGADFLATLPAGAQAQVKAAANGDIAIPPPSARSPQAQAIRSAVMQYDPTYTDARYKGKQNFKTAGDAQNVVQLSTAMEHADRAIANSAKAGFAPALGSKTFESPESAAYMQDAEFLTGEVGKLVKNGVLSVDEGNKISSGLTASRQSVRDSALNETMDLLGGKARAVFQKYKTATGQDLPQKEFFDPKTQQRLTKYGIVQPDAGSDPFAAFGGKAH